MAAGAQSSARARGAETHRGAAGDAGNALGNEACALLVPRQHVTDRASVQRVVERQIRTAGNSSDGRDALTLQQSGDDFCAGEFHGELLLGGYAPCAAYGDGGAKKTKPPPAIAAGRGSNLKYFPAQDATIPPTTTTTTRSKKRSLQPRIRANMRGTLPSNCGGRKPASDIANISGQSAAKTAWITCAQIR